MCVRKLFFKLSNFRILNEHQTQKIKIRAHLIFNNLKKKSGALTKEIQQLFKPKVDKSMKTKKNYKLYII